MNRLHGTISTSPTIVDSFCENLFSSGLSPNSQPPVQGGAPQPVLAFDDQDDGQSEDDEYADGNQIALHNT